MKARSHRVVGGSLCVVLAVLLAAPDAGATPNFPDALRSTWDLPALPVSPPCLLCHSNAAGGTGTAVTPFGSFLRSRGLRAYDLASLRNALEADRGEKHDSDGNGLSDYDDLRAGEDPNGAASAGDGAPRYGCTHAAGGASAPTGPFGLALVAFAWLVRRRRKSPSV